MYVTQELGYPFHILWHFLSDITDLNKFIAWAHRIEPLTAMTNSTFLIKKNQMIEMVSTFDLLHAPKNNEDPDKFIISIDNFIELVTNWFKLKLLVPQNIFIVINDQIQVALQTEIDKEQQAQIEKADQANLQKNYLELLKIVTPLPILIKNDALTATKAIITAFFHYDYERQLKEKSWHRLLLEETDVFGSIQGYLDMPSETKINSYQVVLFPPTWEPARLHAEITSAYQNIVEYTHRIIDENNRIKRAYFIGKSSSGMLIQMAMTHKNQIIQAYPIFNKE